MGIIIGVLIIAIISGYAYNNIFINNAATNSSTNSYTAYGVSFKYPNNWDVDNVNEFDGNLIILSYDKSTSVQIYMTPIPSYYDRSRGNKSDRKSSQSQYMDRSRKQHNKDHNR